MVIKINGINYDSTEHYYQEQKFTDPEYKKIVRLANTANIARELASLKIKGGYPWRTKLNPIIEEAVDRGVEIKDDWDDVKDEVMYVALKAKFTQNNKLKNLLLSTGNKLIQEASPRDSYWGIGKDGKGLNKLGKLLMKVRDELN